MALGGIRESSRYLASPEIFGDLRKNNVDDYDDYDVHGNTLLYISPYS